MKTSNTKAISEIVGTVLILAVTVTLGVLIVSISSNTIQLGVLNQQNQATLVAQQLQERLVVYDVWFYPVNNIRNIGIHMYDYGKVPIHLVTLYTNYTGTQTQLANFTTTYSNGVIISPGQQVTILVPFGYTKSAAYDIIFVSDSGTTFESLWSA